MDDDLKAKVLVLEERIFGVKESQLLLKDDMDKKFTAIDCKLLKLSDQVHEGFAELKEIVSESKGFFSGSKWMAGLVMVAVGTAGSFIGFILKGHSLF